MMEQRRNQRFDLRLPIEILGEQSEHPKGETRNVSSCGVLFTTPEPFEVGVPIEYLITLPKAPGTRAGVRLKCIGKVVRSDGAVRSDEPTLTFAATLERYEFVRGKA
jgi:hypothetical protein